MKSFQFVLALCSLGVALAGCNGGSSTNPPPTLPSAASLPASCTAGAVGSNYSCQLSVSQGNPPFAWAATGLPKGLSLVVGADTSSATISGAVQPLGTIAHTAERGAAAASGAATDPSTTASVTVTVTDAKGRSASVAFSIAISFPPLGITTPFLPAGTAGSPYSATVSAAGGIANYNWTISGLPAGLTFTSGTPSARISGTTNHVGTFSVTMKVSDSESTPATASVTLSLTIAQAATLTVSSSTLPNGTVSASYSQTLAATGGVTPYAWSVASGSLPAGLTLSAAGVISGTPTTSGTSTFTVMATDAESPAQTATKALSITVAAPALSITTNSLPSGVVGISFSNATLQTSGGQPPVTWSISAGTLPAGLSLNVSTGAISGTPTTPGTSTFTVKATDSSTPTPQTVTKQLSIQVFAALAIATTSPLPGGTAGTAYSATVTATGGVTPYSWTISGLPAGFTSTSGTPSATISGTTTHVGTFSVAATVTDSEATPATASVTLSLTIIQAATLTISTTTLPSGTVNTSYGQTLAASGGVTPYAWSVASGSLPTGLTLSAVGVISGTPTASGTSTFTVKATDAESPAQTATQALSITINPASIGLNITTTSPLMNATLNSAYSVMVTATGGTQPYTWTIASGSVLPAGLSLTSATPSATISGTPTVTGTFQFTLNVKDSAGTPATASASFLLAISGSTTLNCPATVNLTLCGTYALGLRGFNGSGGQTVFGAAIVADNSGHIISGTEVRNDSVTGSTTITFTGGSYVMDSTGDGRGVLTVTSSAAAVFTFRFTLESAANADFGPIEEFDNSGILAEGIILGPEATPVPQIPANTVLSLSLEGVNSAGQRVGLLGNFAVGSAGCDGSNGSFNSQAGEPIVTNTAGSVNAALTVTGSCTAANTSTGAGTAQITISGGTPFTSNTLHFEYLVAVSAGVVQGALFLQTDAIGSNQPVLSGLGLPAVTPGSVSAGQLGSLCPCLLVTGATTTGTVTSGGDIASIVRVTSSASGSFSGVVDQNAGGSITTQGTWAYTSYTVDSNGVGTITGPGQPIVHFIVDNGGTVETLDESSQMRVGSMRTQNSIGIESPGAGYVISRHLGVLGVTKNTVHVNGVVVPTGTTITGTLPGVVDVISSAGSIAAATASGSYNSISSTTGRGTGTASLNGGNAVNVVIYAFRHRHFLILDVQSINPYVMGAHLQ